ncbi:MAG: hypothetical protein WC492_03245 [Candidatus Micrarchaeia archaeon]
MAPRVKEFLRSIWGAEVPFLECRLDISKIKDNGDMFDKLKTHLPLSVINSSGTLVLDPRKKKGQDLQYYPLDKNSDFAIFYAGELNQIGVVSLELDMQKLELLKKVLETDFNQFVTCSDISDVKDAYVKRLCYFLIFRKYIQDGCASSKFCDSTRDRILTGLNIFETIAENKNNAYIVAFFMCAAVEELLYLIGRKAKIAIKPDTIGRVLGRLKGEQYLTVQYPTPQNKNLLVYDSFDSSTNIFSTKNPKDKFDCSLVDEVNDIRTSFVHFSTSDPNIPADCLTLIINLGMLLRWCEDNGYL